MIIAVSVLPLSFKLRLHTIGKNHDFGHYVVFSITGILFCLAIERWSGRWLLFLFGIVFALAQEWAENALYHAGYEWHDVWTDLAGLITGYVFMLMVTGLIADSKRSRPVDS